MKTQARAQLDMSARALIRGFCAYAVNRGSNISDHVLLNLLNELGKSDKIRAFYLFFAMNFINSIKQVREC